MGRRGQKGLLGEEKRLPLDCSSFILLSGSKPTDVYDTAL